MGTQDNELEGFEALGGNITWNVLVPKKAPTELKLMIMAALATYQLGQKSIDRTLQRYKKMWMEKLNEGRADLM